MNEENINNTENENITNDPLRIIEEANVKTLKYFNETYVENLELVQSLKTELFELEVQIETLEKTRDLYTYHIDSRRGVFSPFAERIRMSNILRCVSCSVVLPIASAVSTACAS